MTTSWPTWVHIEEYGAMHDLPVATKGNGFDGLDTELKINTPPFVKHLNRLLEMSKEGLFKYGGRDAAAGPRRRAPGSCSYHVVILSLFPSMKDLFLSPTQYRSPAMHQMKHRGSSWEKTG